MLVDAGPAGHLSAVGLLVVPGAATAASGVVRPPKTVPSAVWRLAIGLALMFLLAPATRFGYFIYPASLVLWLAVSRFGMRQAAAQAPPAHGGPPAQGPPAPRRAYPRAARPPPPPLA